MAGDVTRHQIGRELYTFELPADPIRQRLYQSGLPEPGDSFDQYMTSGKQRNQHLVDDLRLSNQPAIDVLAQCIDRIRITWSCFVHNDCSMCFRSLTATTKLVSLKSLLPKTRAMTSG